MKRYFFAVIFVVVAGSLPATAQTGNESFSDFRQSINKDFQSFRKKVLDDYADFLDGVWKEYNSFKGAERDTQPKPISQPVVTGDEAIKPAAPKQDITPKYEPPLPATPKRDIPSPARPKPALSPTTPAYKNIKFMYHSVALEAPEIEWKSLPAGNTPDDFANLWREFSALKLQDVVLPAIIKGANDCKFNDWFLCESIRSYADNVMASMQPGQRMSLAHYLLSYAGFDVRIGLTAQKEPLLLVALKQDVYGRGFTTLNNKKYYLFFDNLVGRDANAPMQFYTCEIPANVDCGKEIDLLIQDELNIPYVAHPYKFNYGGLQIEGEVNANLMPLLYHYPQMKMAYYAQSVVSQSTQKEVARQIAAQLEATPKREAVDKLLKFVQSAFAYATDGEQHGFEKPYFFEEMLFYPKCDCEDRSMFYSYLLKMSLGLENHLISYPGHESVSVNLGETIEGHSYEFENKRFYISDPTYVGAKTGMCMPEYVNIVPQIDFKR